MFLDAIVRRYPALKVLSETAFPPRLTGQLSLATAQVEAEGQEESRAGRRFAAGVKNGVTGIAPAQTPSAATAQWFIWNGDSNRSYVFDQLWAYLVSGTDGPGASLLYAICTAPSEATSGTDMAIQNLSNGGLTSKATYNSNITITNPASGNVVWMMAGKSDCAGTSATGTGILADNLKGRIILPPTSGLALSVISAAGSTPLWVAGGMWCEKELDLE